MAGRLVPRVPPRVRGEYRRRAPGAVPPAAPFKRGGLSPATVSR